MTQDELKLAVAQAAIAYVVEGEIVGVGTGSTANFFIEELAKIKHKIKAAVASSEVTAARLRSHGITVLDLNEVTSMPVYIDGADEITPQGAMIKGGGAALTREKIVASVAEKFICIADGSKLVDVLGKFPLPVEVVEFGHGTTARRIMSVSAALGYPGLAATLRMKDGAPFRTDGGNVIYDCAFKAIKNAVKLGKKKWGDYTAEDGDPAGDRWLPNECDARLRSTWFWNTKGE
ncbi:MAG: ribose-5-phosphate isomerase RpiA, partial [Burkholderiales bacterium]|nr:ribose-5-phosphate isomerase RpiA [Burkholderiales bacterium]